MVRVIETKAALYARAVLTRESSANQSSSLVNQHNWTIAMRLRDLGLNLPELGSRRDGSRPEAKNNSHDCNDNQSNHEALQALHRVAPHDRDLISARSLTTCKFQ